MAGPMEANLFGLSRAELERDLAAMGEPAYRARQVYVWLYRKRARAIEAMTNLPKPLRQRLAERYQLRWPEVRERRESADGTVKFLFGQDDADSVEAVYIPESTRRTICVSTQAGCPLKCGFCLTGVAGYRRNLQTWEILGQVAAVMGDAPRREQPWNLVLMGMGEPLLNLPATLAALRILMDPEGFAVAPKKLTLSTVGILPGLTRLMQEPVRPNLAISLHAAEPELRRRLMPIEDKYPLAEVLAAARRYPIPKGGRVTYEYVLLGGVNDTPHHARALVKLLGGDRAKVNLIPLNPDPEIPFEPPTPAAVDAFCEILVAARLTVSVRRPRGQDILAACGQLHLRRPAPLAVSR
jgi:23S rRNA (adenine2503-C2)-methyltransferase